MVTRKLERERILRRAECLAASLESDERFWLKVAKVQLGEVYGRRKRR